MSYTARIYKIWDIDENKNKKNIKLIGSKSSSLKDLMYNSKRTYGFDKIGYEVLKTWKVNSKKEIDRVLIDFKDKFKDDKLLSDDDVKSENDLPQKLLTLINDNCKATTGSIYKSQLRKFCMFCNNGVMGFKYSFLHDLKKIEEYKDTLTVNCQSQFSCGILVAKRLLHEYEMKQLEQMNRDVSNKQQTKKIEGLNNPKKLKITVEKIKEIANKMNGNDINSLIAHLYALEPAKRPDTWARCKIGKNNNEDNQYNYIDLDTGILHLNQYKTVSTYGKKNFKLDDVLINKIKAFHNKHNNEFLLPKITANNLSSKILKKIFSAGANDLRHAYITKTMNEYGADSKEFIDLCYRMNTSPSVGILSYDSQCQIINRNPVVEDIH